MKSSACRCEDHLLCDQYGKVRLATGRTIRCECACHHFAIRKRAAVAAKLKAKQLAPEDDNE